MSSVRVGLASAGWTPDHPVLRSASTGGRRSRSRTPASASRRRSSGSSSRRSSRPTPARRASTAAPASAWPSAANWRRCSAAKSGSPACPAQGSTFTLYLPLHYAGPDSHQGAAVARRPRRRWPRARAAARRREEHVADDRDEHRGRRPDCCSSSRTIRTTRASCSAWRATRASRGIVASKGALGLSLARQYRPTAITLDIFLPDMLGWTVLNNLKLDPATRHIPVQIVTLEEERQHGLSHGAFSYLVKSPTTDGLEAAFDRIKATSRRRARSGCWSSRTTTSSASRSSSCSATTTSRSSPSPPAHEALEALRDQPVRLRGARPAPARHDRLRAARADRMPSRRWRTCRSSSSPART